MIKILSADYLDKILDGIVELYSSFETTVLEDIARRISKMDYATSTAAFQIQQLQESGVVYQSIIKEIAKLTGASQEEIAVAFESASIKSLRFDDSIYQAVGKSPVPLAQSEAMLQILKANIIKTSGDLLNLTRTTVVNGQQLFLRATTLAQMQVQSGAFDYNTAIKNAVKMASTEGLRVTYPSGESRSIESAVRANVLTGVNQTTGKLTEMRSAEMGAKYYETSAHSGARNTGEGYENHESWQGERFLKVGSDTKYRNFVETTGYGLIGGLMGANCRHSFYSVPEEAPPAMTQKMLKSLDKPDVKFGGKTYTYYEATQKQRHYERGVRKWKTESKLMEAAGIDNTFQNSKIREWQSKARKFSKSTGVKRDYVRERVA